MVSNGRIASGWLGLVRVAGRCPACGGRLDTPVVVGKYAAIYVGEIYLCTDCIVRILVKAAVACNYSGSITDEAFEGMGRGTEKGDDDDCDTDRLRDAGRGVRRRVGIGKAG